MANKDIALDFLNLVVAKRIDEAYQKHIDMNGKHHNVWTPAGMPALREGMRAAHMANPDMTLHVKRVLEDGDLVAVHSHVIPKPGHIGMVTVHIFKIVHGKIVELWDVGLPIPEDMTNKDGAF